MDPKIIQDLVDTATFLARGDRKDDSRDNKIYGTMSGSTLVVGGQNITSYITLTHVGTLETGDVVEVDHYLDKKRLTIVGKIGFPIRTQVGRGVFAYKTANENVTSSTTLQSDDHLFVAVVENAVYSVDGMFIVGGDDLGDFKFNFAFPTSATLSGGQLGMLDTLAGAASTAGDGNWRGLSNETTPSTALANGIADTNFVMVSYRGTLVVGATAGNLALQWAQNTSSLTATSLKIGSHLKVVRES